MKLNAFTVITIAGALVAGIAASPPPPEDGPGGSSEGEQVCTTDPATGETSCENVYDNDVECGTEAEGTTDVGGLFYLGQEGSPEDRAGGAEICSDGSNAVPVQGRVGIGGSAGDQEGTVYADGDKHNGEGSAAGWARVDIGTDGATVRCGDDNGNLDVHNPGPEDGQEDCG